jgi:NADH-quinone oxidoreductase subunit F
MSEIDLTPFRIILQNYSAEGRTALLPTLHAAQEVYGYIPDTVASEIGRSLHVALAEVYGVIDFYTLFYRQPVGKTVVRICGDPACSIAGADSVLKSIERHFEGKLDEPIPDIQLTIERAPCLGLCEHAPAMLVDGMPVIQPVSQTPGLEGVFKGSTTRPHTNVGGTIHLLTENCGRGYTTSLIDYQLSGGYAALQKALLSPPSNIITEIKNSGLLGRGGAAFPTGLKWESASNSSETTRYLVCNADEAEPGTFKDRVVMEDDPHKILEGIIIASYAVGAHKAFIYIRGEYVYAYRIMGVALNEATAAGYVGKNILGSGFDLEIEIRQGAGAYVCGEETALFESIEGKRGFPRMKPPFPTTNGLFGKPTVINNVETLSNIPLIINIGSFAYRKIGTEKSPGPKLFCLSGDIVLPGLYEIPFGMSIRQLIYELAGGIPNEGQFQAALIGGAAGTFASSDQLDVRLSIEDLRAAGLSLGSGVITVFNDTRDLRDILVRLSHFFAEESCGKCFPCQIGSQRQHEILQRIAAGGALPEDLLRLQEIGATMTDASLCGLGQTASSAILSAAKQWPQLFAETNPHATN